MSDHATSGQTRAAADPDDPYLPPALTLRLCFSGHRAGDLNDRPGVTLDVLGDRCADAFQMVTDAFETAHQSLGDQARFVDLDAPLRMRFASSMASGGDMMALEAAVRQGYDLHLLLPFPADDFIAKQRFTAAEKTAFEAMWSPDDNAPEAWRTATRTEIDLGENKAELSPYASCGRLMLDHADVLIALWDGKTDKGPGGTRDVMRDAQRRGHTVVRIHSKTGSIGVWVPEKDAADPAIDGHFTDAKDAPGDVKAQHREQIAKNLRQLILPPAPAEEEDEEKHEHHAHLTAGPFKWLWTGLDWVSAAITHGIYRKFAKERTAAERLKHFKAEHRRRWTLISGFYALQLLFGVRKLFWPVLRTTDTGETSWAELNAKSAKIGGSDFSAHVAETIHPLWLRADELANYFSHVFRTAYILSFVLSVLAVATGLFIVFEADKTQVYARKGDLVTAELFIILLILVLVYLGLMRRWQKRWIDYRSLAEILRPTRVPLLIGSVPARSGEQSGPAPGNAWIAWYVRSHLRAIPPPNGRLDPNGLKTAIRFAIDHEIKDQVDYHRTNADRLGTLDHRMHILATSLLLFTIFGGLAYLGLLHTEQAEVYKQWKPYATFFGGILPVCGAAINGIRATGDFRSAADQSKRTADALERLSVRLETECARKEPRRNHVRALLNEAVRVMADDLNVWSMIYSQRELGPGVG